MVEKAIPRYIFVTSLAITIVIFVAGLLLGYALDDVRSGDILEDLKLNEVETESYVVEQMFWESVEGEGCGSVELRMASVSEELGELGNLLADYQSKSLFSDEEFVYLARSYFLQEIKSYSLFVNMKDKCEFSNDVILFFYSPDDADSESQGYVLDMVVGRTNHTVAVYSINAEFEGEDAIEALKLYYEIDQLPTMIINGEDKLEGYATVDEVLELLE